MRSRSSPGSRAGSAIARSFSPAFDRHGRAYKTALGAELIHEIITVDDVHPLGKPCSKRVTGSPH